MRILHVLTSPRAEGTPRLVLDWLTVKEHEQYVLFLNSNPADLLALFREATDKIEMHDTYSKNYLSKCLNITLTVRHASRKFKPDILISWNQGYSHWIVLGARLGGVNKTIVHGGCEPQTKGFKNLLYSYYVHWPLYLMGSKLICASQFIHDTFKRIPLLPKRNIHFAYNCLQYQKFLCSQSVYPKQENIAIVVANLEPVKNHIALLKAWKLVVEKLPNAKLWIVGRGSLRSMLEDYCSQNKLSQQVVFWGERNDVPELLQKAKIFVLPSTSEGFGTVLIEALAVGLQIVASDIPACREVLQNGRFGTLVDVTDTRLFAQKIIEALEHRLQDETKRNETLEYVKQFAPESMVKRYIEILAL
ncbi:MAG: glycosyltransferase [Bacteroidales bacterium]|nr:glycosyltransferase [Bacteroidales bacterium]